MLKAGLMHIDSGDVTPGLSHTSDTALPGPASKQSPRVTFHGSSSGPFIHGRSKQRKLEGRCVLNANTNPPNELSGAEPVPSAEEISILSQVKSCDLQPGSPIPSLSAVICSQEQLSCIFRKEW